MRQPSGQQLKLVLLFLLLHSKTLMKNNSRSPESRNVCPSAEFSLQHLPRHRSLRQDHLSIRTGPIHSSRIWIKLLWS